MTRFAMAAALAAASIASPALAQSSDPVPTQGVREIDWPVGVASMNAASVRTFGAGVFQRFSQSPIPVLAPAQMDEDDREAFADTFRPLSNGYFAVIHGERYDVIVNGTRSFSVAPAGARVTERDVASEPLFEPAEIGANVSLNRYGVDYLLEFECNEAPPLGSSTVVLPMGAVPNCVDYDEAMSFANSLVIVGGGGS